MRTWEDLAQWRAKATVLIVPCGMVASSIRPRRLLTLADRDLAARVVATADRINQERPVARSWPACAPPPMAGTLDRRPIVWPVASVVAMVLAVLLAFHAASR